MWEGHASEVHKRKGDMRTGHMLARVIYATHMPERHILGRRWAHGLEEVLRGIYENLNTKETG